MDRTAEDGENKVSAPPNVIALIERFQRNRDVCTRPEYKETQVYIEATDRQIDALVYELCGLTEEEITIIEREGERGKCAGAVR